MRITQIQHICKLFYFYASNADVKKILSLAEKVGWEITSNGYSEIGENFDYYFTSSNGKLKDFWLDIIAKAEGYSDPEQALFSGKLHIDQMELFGMSGRSNCKFNYNFGSKSVLFSLVLVSPLLYNYFKSIKIKGKRLEFDMTLTYYSFLQFSIKWPHKNKVEIRMKEDEKGKVCSFRSFSGKYGLIDIDYSKEFAMDGSYSFLLELDNIIDEFVRKIKDGETN